MWLVLKFLHWCCGGFCLLWCSAASLCNWFLTFPDNAMASDKGQSCPTRMKYLDTALKLQESITDSGIIKSQMNGMFRIFSLSALAHLHNSKSDVHFVWRKPLPLTCKWPTFTYANVHKRNTHRNSFDVFRQQRNLLPFLTHCGRVTQICVFNTVKLGTSASSP